MPRQVLLHAHLLVYNVQGALNVILPQRMFARQAMLRTYYFLFSYVISRRHHVTLVLIADLVEAFNGGLSSPSYRRPYPTMVLFHFTSLPFPSLLFFALLLFHPLFPLRRECRIITNTLPHPHGTYLVWPQ